MPEPNATKTELEFSGKYNAEHSRRYFYKHNQGLGRRFSNWCEQAMAEQDDRRIFAADNSDDMLRLGLELRDKVITDRIEGLVCSAFDIPKPDNFVENVFCMRLLHHIGQRKDRITMLKEFARVASVTVCISLWVDGNYKAMRRRQLEKTRAKRKYQNRFIFLRKDIEAEFIEAGLKTIGHVDFLKYYSMWRTYVLRVHNYS